MEDTRQRFQFEDISQTNDLEKTKLLQSSCSFKTHGSITQVKKQPRKASKTRKLVVFISCVAQLMLCNGITYGLSVMYAELVVVFGVKRADAALVQSLNVGLIGAGILFAGVIRKYGPGKCISVATIITSIGLFISAFATDIWLIVLFTGILAGLGMCVNYLASFVTISLIFCEDASFFLISLTSGTSLGQFIVPFLYELFISQYSWSGAFILLSGVSLNCLQFGLIIHYSRDFFYQGDITAKRTSKVNAFCDVTLLTDYVIWMLWTNFLLLALSANVETWFVVDHAVSIGLPRSSGSLMVSAIGLGTLIGRITGSIIRFKCTKTPTIYHWIYLLVVMGILHIFIANMNQFLLLLLGCLGLGIASGTAAAQAPGIMFDASGLEKYPQAMAMVNVMYGIGEFLGDIVGGIIKDAFGVYDIVFYAASVISIYVCISSTVAALILRDRTHKLELIKENGSPSGK